jgi:site-specific DNA recombinase
MRAAIYARVSTERQGREQTIDSQLSALRGWATTHGHEVLPEHVYTDEGYSGSRLDRPALDRLRDAVQDGAVAVVAVLTPDRLARKYAYQVLLLEEFRKGGCEIVFVQRPCSDDPHDQLLLQIQGAVAEYERAVLGERFRRGKLQKARAGYWIGGRAPYGYRYVPRQDSTPGRLVVEDAEAELVRLLYRWLVEEQMTIRQILRRLNAGPWRPRCGKRRWSPAVVHRILSDPLYAGTAYANRYSFAPPKKPRSRGPRCGENTARRPRPRAEWIAIPIPPLIDDATCQRAREQLRRNAALSFRNNTRYSYLLRCLLTCRTCGLAMFGVTHRATSRNPERRYYKCHGRDCIGSTRDEPCPQRMAKAEELEAAVWGHVRQLLADPEALLTQFQSFARQARDGDAEGRAGAEKAAGILRRLTREEQRLLDAYQAGVLSLEELGPRRKGLAERRAALEEQRKQEDHLRQEAAKARQVLDDLTTFCRRIRARLGEASLEERQKILGLLIERVIVGEGTLEIRHVIPLRDAGPGDGRPPAPDPGEERLRSDGVDNTALPARFREALAHRLDQAEALVGGHEADAPQAPRPELPQGGQPAGRVLLAPLHDPEHLPVPVGVDAHGHQDGDVADLAAPRPLQPDAVEEDVGVLALQGPVAPRLDAGVDLLVQLADGARGHFRAPQGLRDILDAAHGDAGQVHLDQRLLDGGLAAAVALDDLRLEGERAQPRHLQLDLAGLGVERAGVAAGAGVEAVGGALVAPGVAEAVGLGVEQGVEGLLDRVADDRVQVLVELALVEANDVAEGFRVGRAGLVVHGRSPGIFSQLGQL